MLQIVSHCAKAVDVAMSSYSPPQYQAFCVAIMIQQPILNPWRKQELVGSTCLHCCFLESVL